MILLHYSLATNFDNEKSFLRFFCVKSFMVLVFLNYLTILGNNFYIWKIPVYQSVNGSSMGLFLPLVINYVGPQNMLYYLIILIVLILKMRASCFSREPGTVWAHFHISLLSVLIPHPCHRSKITVTHSLFSTRCSKYIRYHSLNCHELSSWLWLYIWAGNFLSLKIIFFCKYFVLLFHVE